MTLQPQRCAVLVVEDERIVAKDIQYTLGELGYEAFGVASSTDEAIARASERCPDLVLMDIRIKGQRDGIEAAKIFKGKFGVPVVYLTAHADEATLERAKESEPYGYLLKPVKPAELRGAIEVSLYKHAMEKRLRERERWFATTLHSMGDGVIAVDLAGRVTLMNAAAEELTGVTAAEAQGRPARDIVRLFKDERRISPLDMALEQRARVRVGEAAMNADGPNRRVISDSAAPVVDDGRVLGAVMVFRDVTEQRQLQQQLELKDRLASLGTMAAGVAHEINNPLAVIAADAWFVRERLEQVLTHMDGDSGVSDQAAGLREALVAQTEIEGSARRIAGIVAQLKEFSRPSMPSGDSADVRHTIEWALRMTAQEFTQRARVISSVSEVPLVALDETRLGQVLLNLLINAAHSIAPGAVENHEVRVTARCTPHGAVAIEVRDTGCGIPPEALSRIFEPFFTTKPIGVGTGLGLSICHGIVSAAGGTLEAESAVGHGSSFRVVLPAVAAPAQPQVEPAPAGARRRGRILVIDDEETVLKVIRRILSEHEVVCVNSARTALGILEREAPFDIIFSDLMMPDMTGIRFYEELQRSRPEHAARVVFMTGGVIHGPSADFLSTVSNPRVEKPFSVEGFRALVQRLLASPRTQSSA